MGATFSVVFESEVSPYGTLGDDHRALLRAREAIAPFGSPDGRAQP